MDFALPTVKDVYWGTNISHVMPGHGDLHTPSLTKSSLRWSRSPTASRRSIVKTGTESADGVTLLSRPTMTRHGDSQINIELEVLLHLLIHSEGIVWSAIKIFSQVVLRHISTGMGLGNAEFRVPGRGGI